jgi:glucose dehydrogenase
MSRTPAQTPWSLQNSDLFNTRRSRDSSITSANVSKLGVAWTMPLTAGSTYGTFAANRVSDRNDVVYLQDLDSNVFAVDLATGRVRWRRTYNSQGIGPNGVSVADGSVYGATAKFAFALDAKTGKELWRNTKLVPKRLRKGGASSPVALESTSSRRWQTGRCTSRPPLFSAGALSTRSTRGLVVRSGRSTR